MAKQKSELVRKGYSKIASEYQDQRSGYESVKLLGKIIKLLPKGAKVLDLGCGAGVPVSKTLADKGYKVTGIDFAQGMLKLARKNVLKAGFRSMDITKMKFRANSFDGAVSYYAIIHIPREKHGRIYKTLHRILKPGGMIFVNASGTDKHGWEAVEDYMGVKMFWSFYGPKRTLGLIEDAGFEILWSKILKIGNEKQFWVLAKNRKQAN